jgi:serine/threonine protein kinase
MNISSSQRIGGHYLLAEKIGKGGMGDVYLGLDERLDRQVAIKQLKIENASHETREASIMRFKLEAKAVAKLNHPHIVSLYDIATENDQFYMVMEYVKGNNLQEILQEQSQLLPVELVVQMGIQLCEALKQAHEHNIIHRDIKPANILVTRNNDIKLTDFGIAQLNQPQDLRMTQAGTLLGSFLYASPEQLVNASEVDARTDIYAVGGTLYELFTGRTAYEADHAGKLIQKVFMEKPVPPQDLNPNLSDVLADIVLRCLDKDPELRFQSATDLLLALYAAIGKTQPGQNENLVLVHSDNLQDTRTTALPSRLGLLKLTPEQNPAQSLCRHLQGQHPWLNLFLQNFQGVFANQNFAEAKRQISQPDFQGQTFSGILTFQDCFVFIKNGLICGAFHTGEQLLNDDALDRLSESSPMLMSYSLPPELVLSVSSLIAGTGTAIQENLDSRVVNLFPILQDLESEVEQFNGYVICQSLGTVSGGMLQNTPLANFVYLYHQGKVVFQFQIDTLGQLSQTNLTLSALVGKGACLLGLYTPTQQMLDTVLCDFLSLACLKPRFLDPDNTHQTLLDLGQSEVSEWMRASLYDGLRKNLELQILTAENKPFPEILTEALGKRKEYQTALWTLSELFILLHSQGQMASFQRLCPLFCAISELRCFQTFGLENGRQAKYTLSAYLANKNTPSLLFQMGQGEPEDLVQVLESTQSFNRVCLSQPVQTGIQALFYLSHSGFDGQSLAFFSKATEKVGLFNKQKGFVKTRGKEGFHLFLIDLQAEKPRLIAPSFF